MVKTTVSLIKADIGSVAGHSVVAKPLIDIANKLMKKAQNSGLINSFFVFNAGDDLELLMTHFKGENDPEIHKLAWDTFLTCTQKAKALKLYGAGQDLLSDAFSGNVKGLGPGVSELEFEERGSDPVVVFAADKTEPSAFNYLLYRIFADPTNTAGLVIDPKMTGGFKFEVFDAYENRSVILESPKELYQLIALIGATSRYMVSKIWRTSDGEIVASSSTTKLSLIAGTYVGKDDPVLLVRGQSGFPSVGEIIAPFQHTYLVAGWMRGSHWGPFMPVGLKDSKCTVFDGPPRIVCLGVQISNGKLASDDDGTPLIVDFFEDVAFDGARQEAIQMSQFLRRMGEFEPARLSPEAMEYTTLPDVLKALEPRFKKNSS
ncbi:MAG: fructose-1,6-bisphosphate aldolase/phosphatase [Candidatus Bathyarchaeota archaeon]|nr:fructose-1,6-bisphosphate aldolase/phosphatase [Candidatus Bathyarchaeota archaeon]